jgi:ribosomal-protein-alanine N-acetyltransferase
VAESEGKIVGYMITCILSDKGDIVSIAVDPFYRRKGVGRALAEFTFKHLKLHQIKMVELEVRTTNSEGISFWKNLGFFPIGTIKSFYRDGADAFRMRKLLDEE